MRTFVRTALLASAACISCSTEIRARNWHGDVHLLFTRVAARAMPDAHPTTYRWWAGLLLRFTNVTVAALSLPARAISHAITLERTYAIPRFRLFHVCARVRQPGQIECVAKCDYDRPQFWPTGNSFVRWPAGSLYNSAGTRSAFLPARCHYTGDYQVCEANLTDWQSELPASNRKSLRPALLVQEFSAL